MSELRVPWARRYGRDFGFGSERQITAEQSARMGFVLLAVLIVALFGVLNNVINVTSAPSAASENTSPVGSGVEIGEAQVIYAPSDGHDGAPLVLVSGKPLFPFGPGHLMSQELDAPVMAQGVKVQQVAGESGLWVGSTDEQRIYVKVPPTVIAFGSIDPKALRVGEEVNLSGRMRPLPQEIATLGLTDTTGAQQLLEQGAMVEADSLSVAR